MFRGTKAGSQNASWTASTRQILSPTIVKMEKIMKAWITAFLLIAVFLGYTVFSFAAPAELPQTGQTYDTVTDGEDGDLRKGIALPEPRFEVGVDGAGTVTDNLTGLVWLQQANCLPPQDWADAVENAATLASGTCGLASNDAGGWRLPNVLELWSLMNYQYLDKSISNEAGTGPWVDENPFTGIQDIYWSSTSATADTTQARTIDFFNALISIRPKISNIINVWPVRQGLDYDTYLTIIFAGQGEGTVTDDSSLNCTEQCVQPYSSGTSVTLTATPSQGSSFVGWSGSGCIGSNETIDVDMSGNITCTATFKSDSMLILMMPAIIGGRENR